MDTMRLLEQEDAAGVTVSCAQTIVFSKNQSVLLSVIHSIHTGAAIQSENGNATLLEERRGRKQPVWE